MPANEERDSEGEGSYLSLLHLDRLLLLVLVVVRHHLLGSRPASPRRRTRHVQTLLDRLRHFFERVLPPFQPLLDRGPLVGREGAGGDGRRARDKQRSGRLREAALQERGADRCEEETKGLGPKGSDESG